MMIFKREKKHYLFMLPQPSLLFLPLLIGIASRERENGRGDKSSWGPASRYQGRRCVKSDRRSRLTILSGNLACDNKLAFEFTTSFFPS